MVILIAPVASFTDLAQFFFYICLTSGLKVDKLEALASSGCLGGPGVGVKRELKRGLHG